MRKILFGLAVVALAVSSCSQSEEQSEITSKKGIGFSAYVNMKPTRADAWAPQVDQVTDNLASFLVTAVGNGGNYFTNVSFAKNASNEFVSTPLYYYPNYQLDFYAYTKATKGTQTVTINKDAQTIAFTPSTNITEQEDLVAAKASVANPSAQTAAVPLTFGHYLTKVAVKASCQNANYTITVDQVKLVKMINSGTYTFSTGNMVATTTAQASRTTEYASTTLTTAATLTATAASVMGNNAWYIIPQKWTAWDQANDKKNENNGTFLAIKALIKTKGDSGVNIYPATGTATGWIAIPLKFGEGDTANTFAQGKSYTITINFLSSTGQGAGFYMPDDSSKPGEPIFRTPIKFTATVTAWDETNTGITIDL